jgi:uncharacterized protein with HEPN domain
MSERTITDFLKDILENIHNAVEFIGTMTFEQFLDDKRTAFAVVRCLEIIGEATKNIPHEIRSSNPDIPWKEFAGMRDRIIHGYWGVDYRIVWGTVKEDLEALVIPLQNVIAKTENQ